MDFAGWFTKKKILAIAAVAVLLSVAVYTVYDLNGNSFDLKDRETRIIVTSSMDGSNHPDNWYECTNDSCPYYVVNQHRMESLTDICSSCDSAMEKHSIEITSAPLHSLVMIKALGQNDMESVDVGDVLAFNYSGRLTIHRVVAIQYDEATHAVKGFTTHGDNASPGANENPSVSDVVGIVVGDSEWLGSLVHFAQNSTILLVMIIVILFVIMSVVRDMVHIKKRKQ